MTIEQILSDAQMKILEICNNPHCQIDLHIRYMDLIADLTELKIKYKEKSI